MDNILNAAKLGFELTFTNNWSVNIGNKEIKNWNTTINSFDGYKNRLEELMMELALIYELSVFASDCINENYGDRINMRKIIFKDNQNEEVFWFIINLDPGVVEIQTMPITYSQIDGFIKDVFESIFNYNYGHHGSGGGHINVDFETGFNKNISLVKHTIDAVEIMYKDKNKMSSLMDNLYNDEQFDPFISTNRMLVSIDHAGNWKEYSDGTDDYYLDWVNKVLNTSGSDFKKNHKEWLFTHPTRTQCTDRKRDGSEFGTRLSENNDDVLHYQSVNIQHIYNSEPSLQRVEFRFFKAQDDLDKLLDDIKIINELVNNAQSVVENTF